MCPLVWLLLISSVRQKGFICFFNNVDRVLACGSASADVASSAGEAAASSDPPPHAGRSSSDNSGSRAGALGPHGFCAGSLIATVSALVC